jgi:predicted deacylase
MSSTQSAIRHYDSPDELKLGDTTIEFLARLEGPTWITVAGQDPTRRRVIVCLLHGNEPSGLHAIHTLLRERTTPATDLGILIAGVDAAVHEPLLSHRFIPGEKDLNRCFAPPYNREQEKLAENILAKIHNFSPEAVVDTHNTSSHSEPFCVSVSASEAISKLASLFTDSLVIIDQKLGTLLEYLDPNIPAVTVEFGGFMDPNADSLAHESLHRFAVTHHLESTEFEQLNYLTHPLRL